MDAPPDDQTDPPADDRSIARLRRAFGTTVNRHRNSDSRLLPLAVLGLHLGLAVAAAAFGDLALRAAPRAGWLVYPLVVLFIGTRLRALGNIQHECTHYTFMPGKRANVIVGRLLALIDFSSFEDYRADHISHHVHLGELGDRDFAPRRVFRFEAPSPRPFLDHVVRPLLLLHLRHIFRPVLYAPGDPPAMKVARALYPLFLVAFAFAVGGKVFLLFACVPYLTTYQMLRYWSDAFDHAGLLGEKDGFLRTRNHLLPGALLNRIFFPRGDAYHLVHHLFPSLPTVHHARIHHLLMTDAGYAARDHALSLRALGRPAPVADDAGPPCTAQQEPAV